MEHHPTQAEQLAAILAWKLYVIRRIWESEEK